MANNQTSFPTSRWTESQQQGIRDAWEQNKNNPAELRKLMEATGVAAQDIGNLTGIDPWTINSAVNSDKLFGNSGGQDRYNSSGMMNNAANLVSNTINGTQGGQGMSGGSPGGGMGAPTTQPGGGMGGGASGGGMGGGGGGSGSYTSGQNPYLAQMGQTMVDQMTTNHNRNVMPAIGSQAMAAGGYGGSRQGVIESNAQSDLNTAIGGGLSSLYGNGYNTAMQYDLGRRNNDLGFGNLGLGYAGLDRNIANDNNSWNMAGANFGLGIYDRLQQGNQAGINAGGAMQNTPMNYWNQFSQGANSLGQGYGTQTGTQQMPGSPMTGALGGAQLGQAAANWWSGGNNSNAGNNYAGSAGGLSGWGDFGRSSGGNGGWM